MVDLICILRKMLTRARWHNQRYHTCDKTLSGPQTATGYKFFSKTAIIFREPNIIRY